MTQFEKFQVNLSVLFHAIHRYWWIQCLQIYLLCSVFLDLYSNLRNNMNCFCWVIIIGLEKEAILLHILCSISFYCVHHYCASCLLPGIIHISIVNSLISYTLHGKKIPPNNVRKFLKMNKFNLNVLYSIFFLQILNTSITCIFIC